MIDHHVQANQKEEKPGANLIAVGNAVQTRRVYKLLQYLSTTLPFVEHERTKATLVLKNSDQTVAHKVVHERQDGKHWNQQVEVGYIAQNGQLAIQVHVRLGEHLKRLIHSHLLQ